MAFFLFCLAAFSDFLDGYWARKTRTISPEGELLDPLADKFFVILLLFFMGTKGYLDSYMIMGASLIIGREIIVMGLRSLSSKKILSTSWGKGKTTCQFFALGSILLYHLTAVHLLQTSAWIFLFFAVILGFQSAFHYFFIAFKKSPPSS